MNIPHVSINKDPPPKSYKYEYYSESFPLKHLPQDAFHTFYQPQVQHYTTMHFASFVALATFFAVPALAAVDLPLVGYVAFVKDGSRITVPNAADGVYTSHNETHLAYYGALNTDSDAPTALE